MVAPVGYFHRSCIDTLAAGERQREDGRILHADGSVSADALFCTQPHSTQAGVADHFGRCGMGEPCF